MERLTLEEFQRSKGRLPHTLRANQSSDNSVTAAFWDVLRDTTGICPLAPTVVKKRAQNFNKSLKRPKEPAICTFRPPALTQDDYDNEEMEEKQAMLDELDVAESEMDIAKFELRMQQAKQSKKKKSDLKQSLQWSRDAPQLNAMVIADKRLSKNTQLHSREFIVGHFKHLVLSKLKIETIDESTREFQNLEELNISQNSVRVIENLPKTLRVLNCYANEIESINEDGVFHDLFFLGAGFNNIASMQTLQNLLPRLGSLANDAERNPIRLPAGQPLRIPADFAQASLDENGDGSKLPDGSQSVEFVQGRVLAPSVSADGTPNQSNSRDNQTYDISVQVAGSDDVDGAGRGRAILQDVGDQLFDWNPDLKVHFFPRVRILDLSFNALTDLSHTLQSLNLLEKLTHLSLMGNPLTLVNKYRAHVLDRLSQLEELDEIAVDDGISSPKQSKQVLPQLRTGDETLIEIKVNKLFVAQQPSDDPVESAATSKKGGKAGKGKGKDKAAAAEAGPVTIHEYAVRVRFRAPKSGQDDVAIVSPFVEIEAAEDAGGGTPGAGEKEINFVEKCSLPLSVALRDQLYFHAVDVDVLVRKSIKQEVCLLSELQCPRSSTVDAYSFTCSPECASKRRCEQRFGRRQ